MNCACNAAGAFGLGPSSSKVGTGYRKVVQTLGSSKQHRNVSDALPDELSSRPPASPDSEHVKRLQVIALLHPSAASAVVRRYPEVGDIKDSAIAARMVLLKRVFPGVQS